MRGAIFYIMGRVMKYHFSNYNKAKRALEVARFVVPNHTSYITNEYGEWAVVIRDFE